MKKNKVLVFFVLKTASTHKDNKQKLIEMVKPFMNSDTELFYTFYDDLVFSVVGEDARIYDTRNGLDIADYDFVHFKHWVKSTEKAATCAEYLTKKNVKFGDTEVGQFRSKSKLSEYFRLWANGVKIPDTLLFHKDLLDKSMSMHANFQFPLIAKDTVECKGRNNYLVGNKDELQEVLNKHLDQDFVVQQFIPNDGDYRIWVFGDEVYGGLFRQRQNNNSHLNNTSQDSTTKLLSKNMISQEVQNIATNAARAVRREVSGVDVVEDKMTGVHYVLEVNGAPEIDTGHEVDFKVRSFADYLNKQVGKK